MAKPCHATPEASIQLSIAARRVDALGSVHHRLHLLNQPAKVEFKQCLIGLCDELSRLLFQAERRAASGDDEVGSCLGMPTHSGLMS
jgi:hypothetical protein